MGSDKLPFKPELQGLRAFAVVAVLLYHVWPQTFTGGFIGVDVFFVISGYLITGLLLAELESQNRIDLARFWARRMLRLLPAASLVLVVSLFSSIYLLPETEWLNIAKQVMSSALYVQNWYLDAQAVDYLRQYEAATPVQHYWSLSIEEQYYAFWPLLIFLCGQSFRDKVQGRKIAIFLLLLLLLVSSLLYSVFWSGIAAEGYFKTASRIWELSTGALLALILGRNDTNNWLKACAGWVGFLLVTSAIFVINEQSRFPGYAALLPVTGTMLLITAGSSRFGTYTLLAKKPLVFLGDISYSLYLWHWPIAIFATKEETINTPWKPVVIIALSLLLAILTKYFVEDVFRNKGSAPLKLPRSYAFCAALILLTCAFAGKIWYHEHQIIQALLAKEESLREQPGAYPGAAAFDPVNPVKPPPGLPIRPDPRTAGRDMNKEHLRCLGLTGSMKVEICQFGKIGSAFRVVLAGDSHAMHYGPALQKIAEVRGWHLDVMTKPACLLGDFHNRQKGQIRYDCELWKKTLLRHITNSKPQLLITSGALSALYDDLPPIRKQIEGYISLWRKIESAGTRIVVLKGTPLMRDYNKAWMNPAACLWEKTKTPEKCNRPRKFVLDAFQDPMVMAAQEMQSVSVIDLTRFLCDHETCYPVIGNVLAYRDSNHLTETFIRTLTPYLDRELLKLSNWPK